MEYWNRCFHAYENYPPEGKVDHRFLYISPWGGREIRYVWSAMMLFCGLEEIFGPEVTRPGVRFGNPHLAREASWNGFIYRGAVMQATAGRRRTRVQCEGSPGEQEWQFTAEPGVTIRGFRHDAAGVQYDAICPKPAAVQFHRRDISAAAGVRVGGKPARAAANAGMLAFELPAGRSSVRIAIG